MSKVFCVRDSSASRRTKAINTPRYDVRSSDVYDDVISHGHGVSKNNNNYPKWDQMSMDSGFCSDLERKVAQLSLAGSDVGSVDEVDDVRAPSRAKLTEEEKRLKNKIRTLPVSGRSTRWHRCDDNVSDVSDDDDDITFDQMKNTLTRHSERKSKTLPLKYDKRSDVITWNDITLADLRQVDVLGGGGYARVDLVEIKRLSGHKFALKKLNKRFLQDRDQVNHVISEKDALKRARCRFIPRLFRTFQTPSHVFMLTEACLGGDLFSVLENHGALHYEATRYVIGCVIEALDHLHMTLNIIHRDVKTENILIDANGVAKLADLGFCKQLPRNCDITYTFCGTPGYVAPEVLLRTGHGRTCDFFSTGVVLFETSTCRSPFRRHSNLETHRATLRGIKDVAFPPFLNHLTIQMIRTLCCSDPDGRLGAAGCEEIRRHEFFNGFDWHRLRHGKMTSSILNLTSRKQASSFIKDDYTENSTEIKKTPFDKTWNDNF
uniref:cGMP-dependent protein kinase 1-like n=1 Tax=Styela clava TaxID=7725 RepID=UPI0019395496|nr:cGMP-dependent protein kinase 1-like [Styela clava]